VGFDWRVCLHGGCGTGQGHEAAERSGKERIHGLGCALQRPILESSRNAERPRSLAVGPHVLEWPGLGLFDWRSLALSEQWSCSPVGGEHGSHQWSCPVSRWNNIVPHRSQGLASVQSLSDGWPAHLEVFCSPRWQRQPEDIVLQLRNRHQSAGGQHRLRWYAHGCCRQPVRHPKRSRQGHRDHTGGRTAERDPIVENELPNQCRIQPSR